MAQPNDVIEQRAVDGAEAEWPALVSRAVNDVSRIVHAEIRLAELGVKSVIEQEIARALKAVLALGFLLCAAFCLVGAAIIGLREVIGLWWASFAVVAGGAGLAGIVLFLWAMRRPSSVALRKMREENL